MSGLNPFDAHPLRREGPKPDAEVEALERLQLHLASERPTGLLRRVRLGFERLQVAQVLEWADSGQTRAGAIAEYRSKIKFAAPALFAVTLVQALWPGRHPFTIVHFLLAFGVSTLGAAALGIWLYRYAPRAADSTERTYAKWLERARALPARREEPALGPGEPSP